MIDFSIIVPIYNAEKVLERCLQSVQLQTHMNYEVIMINDGSTDGSERIAARYSNMDERFKLYTIENNGVSNARNVGMFYAEGEYICFIDSDDYIEHDMLECLYTQLNEKTHQLALIGINHVCENKVQKVQTYECYGEELSQGDYLNHIHDENGYCGYVWNKVFKTEIIKQHNIQFPKGILICEDLIFCVEYGQYIESACIIPKPFYNYVAYENSVTHTLRYEAIKSREKAMYTLMEYCDNPLFSKYREFVLQTRKFCTSMFLMNIYVGDFRNSIYDRTRIRECVRLVEKLGVIKESAKKLRCYYVLLKVCPRFAYFIYGLFRKNG